MPQKGGAPGLGSSGSRTATRTHKNFRKNAPTRRRTVPGNDNTDVTPEAVATEEPDGLLAVYDSALPHVYGYLAGRVGRGALAEDLTAETFLAAVDAVRAGRLPDVTVGWLIGTARHKLVDHWRRQAREERKVRAVRSSTGDAADDDWDVRLDAVRAHETLATLSPLYRAVLTLGYLDDLSVPAVADAVDRSLHATEGLLVRARASFRRAYDADEVDDA